MKKYQNFLSKNFQFLVVKFSIYLNRRVFVMIHTILIWDVYVVCCSTLLFSIKNTLKPKSGNHHERVYIQFRRKWVSFFYRERGVCVCVGGGGGGGGGVTLKQWHFFFIWGSLRLKHKCSRTSMARTPIARLPWAYSNSFLSPYGFFFR